MCEFDMLKGAKIETRTEEKGKEDNTNTDTRKSLGTQKTHYKTSFNICFPKVDGNKVSDN